MADLNLPLLGRLGLVLSQRAFLAEYVACRMFIVRIYKHNTHTEIGSGESAASRVHMYEVSINVHLLMFIQQENQDLQFQRCVFDIFSTLMRDFLGTFIEINRIDQGRNFVNHEKKQIVLSFFFDDFFVCFSKQKSSFCFFISMKKCIETKKKYFGKTNKLNSQNT